MTKPLTGFSVAAFESRLGLKLGRLLESLGAQTFIAPSFQEVPVTDTKPVFDLFDRIQKGKIDILVALTGVGLRGFLSTLETRFDKPTIQAALAKTAVAVRGPKPLTVCNLNNIAVAVKADEPNTSHELADAIQTLFKNSAPQVAIIEYGAPSPELTQNLIERGAMVETVILYRYAFPDDKAPLFHLVEKLSRDEIDIVLFTSAGQVDFMMAAVKELKLETPFRRSLARTVISSIGPVTSTRLREYQLFADFEASPNKLETLIDKTAVLGPELVRHKQERAGQLRVHVQDSQKIPNAASELQNSLMMKILRGEITDRVPIWLMRQAGRYMAEYQQIRKGTDFIGFCENPKLCAEATITAVERLGVDAAIIFSDILLPLKPLGFNVTFEENHGPRISPPLRNAQAVKNISLYDPSDRLSCVMDAIGLTRRHLHPRIPLIGFAGAPFTLAAYLIEGGGSKNFIPTKVFMKSEPSAWQELMTKLTDLVARHLNAQIKAGCQIVQIFDSWAGALSPSDYQTSVLPFMKNLIPQIQKDVPVIHFGGLSPSLYPLQKEIGATAVSLGWQTDLSEACKLFGPITVLQGNLDPVMLFSKPEIIRQEAKKILDAMAQRDGFIFNVGHGILPETPVDHVMALVDFVKGWRK